MQKLIDLFQYLNNINPMLTAATIGVVVGVIANKTVAVPLQILKVIFSYTIHSLELINDSDYEAQYAYKRMSQWLVENKINFFTRSLNMSGIRWSGKTVGGNGDIQEDWVRVAPGTGWHVAYGMGHFYIVNNSTQPSTGDKVIRIMKIYTFGYSDQALMKLINHIRIVDNKQVGQSVFVYMTTKNEWVKISNVNKTLDFVAIDDNKRKTLIETIQTFLDNKEFYIKNGISYKTGILLTGEPGGGKTTLSKAIAGSFKMNIYVLDLSEHTNASLISAVLEVPERSIVLLEDIDCAGASVEKRHGASTTKFMLEDKLTLSGIFNVLDGVISPTGVIFIATTNHPEILDPGLIRGRRMDLKLNIGKLSHAEINHYALKMYGKELPFVFDKTLMGNDLESIFLANIGNYDGFCESLQAIGK